MSSKHLVSAQGSKDWEVPGQHPQTRSGPCLLPLKMRWEKPRTRVTSFRTKHYNSCHTAPCPDYTTHSNRNRESVLTSVPSNELLLIYLNNFPLPLSYLSHPLPDCVSQLSVCGSNHSTLYTCSAVACRKTLVCRKE